MVPTWQDIKCLWIISPCIGRNVLVDHHPLVRFIDQKHEKQFITHDVATIGTLDSPHCEQTIDMLQMQFDCLASHYRYLRACHSCDGFYYDRDTRLLAPCRIQDENTFQTLDGYYVATLHPLQPHILQVHMKQYIKPPQWPCQLRMTTSCDKEEENKDKMLGFDDDPYKWSLSQFPNMTFADRLRIYTVRTLHALIMLVIVVDVFLTVLLWFGVFSMSKRYHRYLLFLVLTIVVLKWLFKDRCILTVGEQVLLQEYDKHLPKQTFTDGIGQCLELSPKQTKFWDYSLWIGASAAALTHFVCMW